MTSTTHGIPVAVIGAGTMGAGIALVAAQSGHPTLLLDVREGAAQDAVDGLRSKLAALAAKGRVGEQEAQAASALLGVARTVTDLSCCGIVVEAVAERLDVKRALFADVEAVASSDCILATNTSSLSVTAMAAGLRHPERVVGLHFFNPADRMRLVEVVRGDATAPDVVTSVVELARSWGKTPVLCTSTPGFIVNRVARPYYGEAQRLAEAGVADPATIDALLREAGGFPLGPFELTDLVGQDVNLAVSRSVWEQTFHDPRYQPTVFQQRLVDAGRYGRKTGRGVFSYGPDGPATDAAPRTEPARAVPDGVVLRTFEGRTGFDDVMGPFLQRIERAAALERVELDEDGELRTPGLHLPGGARLCELYGPPASESYADEDAAVILLDWAYDPASCTRVALSPSADCPPESLDAAVALCQAAGAQVSVVGEAAGGIVARTVAMIINEAVELVRRREATAEDVDVAMLLGTGYPSGPFEWSRRPGVDVPFILERVHEEEPTGRYRVSPVFERAERSGRALHEL